MESARSISGLRPAPVELENSIHCTTKAHAAPHGARSIVIAVNASFAEAKSITL